MRRRPAQPPGRWTGTLRLVLIVVLATAAFRTLVFSPFVIPSDSMVPNLVKGDFLIAAKWPYGYSRWSLPFDAPLPVGRVLANNPQRGDIAIFRHPVDGREYVKRVIGLPGDRVALRGGALWLNGAEVPREPMEDFRQPARPRADCPVGSALDGSSGSAYGAQCGFRRHAEILPGGRRYAVVDLGPTALDSYGPVTVPAGGVFVLGDNRDNSQDSRFRATAGGGVGMVPMDRLVARATMVLFSSDGAMAPRWDRIGLRL